MGVKPPRRYWLTGAGDGVAASLAVKLLDSGAHLAISSRSTQPCEALDARYPDQLLIVPGDLTDSQTVRKIGERIAQQWGALDTVILNAGTTEYAGAQPTPQAFIEHLVRSNLLAASLCIETALPLLQAGIHPHLTGIASPATCLSPSHTEASGSTMRSLFESTRTRLAPEGIDVTLVHPGFDDVSLCLDNGALPTVCSTDEAATYILTNLAKRPPELILPVAALAALWPLPASTRTDRPDIAPCQPDAWSPIKGRP
ncbi:SDR family NAD(P)-dependent oxidoreductase [Pseudomonas sp. AF32]|uniref:SDR family NAD(P)-dependent oxidoreductase n=1 Tax=Pseudomonas sp. AF32 TaxID=554390 RepID=UPI001EED0E0C|nr:SDR family NAD(P)-dependent oxidoreductase [Pseudomonas sp. AF32]MCG6574976.1 SDR family NAD(P)-dependent oxidoreductase [Pseudomonas sp. AF32]